MKLDDLINWDFLFMKMKNNENFMYPNEQLLKQIDISSWNNIPIPLVKTTEIFEQSFQNVCNIIAEVID
jgi:hypothetical protein